MLVLERHSCNLILEYFFECLGNVGSSKFFPYHPFRYELALSPERRSCCDLVVKKYVYESYFLHRNCVWVFTQYLNSSFMHVVVWETLMQEVFSCFWQNSFPCDLFYVFTQVTETNIAKTNQFLWFFVDKYQRI